MNNKFVKGLISLIKSGCVIFTIAVFTSFLFAELVSEASMILSLKAMFFIFLFSIWLAASNLLLTYKKFNYILRIVLHFIASFGGFFLICIYLYGILAVPKTAFFASLAYVLVYSVIVAAYLGIRAAINRNKSDDNDGEKYESIYKK